MATTKIQATKNYKMFDRNPENRPINASKHRMLRESMEKYGFLRCFPIVVRRDGSRLVVKDGQHRLTLAETLGLPVWWIEEETDFDIATINNAAKTWTIRDYALKFAATGHADYVEGLEFAAARKLPASLAFALLAGTTTFTNCVDAFKQGTWKVKDRAWAESVADIYGPLAALEPKMKGPRLVEACMAVCRIEGFDPRRLLQGARGCREKLVAYATRDGYLDLLEHCYNFRRSQMVGLKVQAIMAMRDRNPMKAKARTKTKDVERPRAARQVSA